MKAISQSNGDGQQSPEVDNGERSKPISNVDPFALDDPNFLVSAETLCKKLLCRASGSGGRLCRGDCLPSRSGTTFGTIFRLCVSIFGSVPS